MSAPEPHLRAADADRERAAALLRRHHDAGRLDVEDLEERLQGAYHARTYGDLDLLFADLPSLGGQLPPPMPMPGPYVAPRPVPPPTHTPGRRAFRSAGALDVLPELAAARVLDVLGPSLRLAGYELVEERPARLRWARKRLTWAEDLVTIELGALPDGRTRVAAFGIAPLPVRKALAGLLR